MLLFAEATQRLWRRWMGRLAVHVQQLDDVTCPSAPARQSSTVPPILALSSTTSGPPAGGCQPRLSRLLCVGRGHRHRHPHLGETLVHLITAPALASWCAIGQHSRLRCWFAPFLLASGLVSSPFSPPQCCRRAQSPRACCAGPPAAATCWRRSRGARSASGRRRWGIVAWPHGQGLL